jgi:CRISPR/Cas system CMR subunit Cmr6 (Cas7 group RAMP superfamily)
MKLDFDSKDFKPVQLIDPEKLIAAMEIAINEMVQMLLAGPQTPKLYQYQKEGIRVAVEKFNESVNELLKEQNEKVSQLIKDIRQ